MAGYKHNHQAGINPWAVGRVVSPLRDWGVGMPGRLAPIQGEPGQAAILTHVVDWPWAEDDQGVPFDQENIWGVRTRSTVVGGDETDWLVAVPKILPSGYTPVGRHGRIVPFIADHLGENPFLGRVDLFDAIDPVRWRTPTGQYPTDLTDDGYLWVPMNLNQQTYTVNIDNIGGFWYTEDVDPDPLNVDLVEWYKRDISDHVGFRGAQISGHIGIGTLPGPTPEPVTGDLTLYIAKTALDDPSPADIGDVDILWSQVIGGGSIVDNDGPWSVYDYSYLIDIAVSQALNSGTLGTRANFHVIMRHHLRGGSGIVAPDFYLGPRTDIPLWYWASTRNKVAPGGVILP